MSARQGSEVPMIVKPPVNQGMTTLDRSKFDLRLPLIVAEIENPRMLTKIVKESGEDDLLELPRLPKVIMVSKSQRGVLLSHNISDVDGALDKLSPKTVELLNEAGFKLRTWPMDLSYKFWNTEEILQSIIPSSLGDIPSGFALVGHIAHINLRDQFLPYKNIIGQVLLDKNQPSIRTVVNKLDTIDTVYRTFDMEVLAGVPEFVVEQHESDCRFRFDFRKVYWNSRLHTEHDRLVSLFGKGKAICDPMAGVGPFAIPAAKKGNVVFANDLNPASYESMEENVGLNKINSEILKTYNEDARDFIRKSIRRLHELKDLEGDRHIPVMISPKPFVKPSPTNAEVTGSEDAMSDFNINKKRLGSPKLKKTSKKPSHNSRSVPETVQVPETFSHYVMNLPASAIEFLDGFRGLYYQENFSVDAPELPLIHVHCFHKFDPHAEEPTEEEVRSSLAERISKAIRFNVLPEQISLHNVRRVAPAKDMYEVTFRLPKEVAYAPEKTF